MIRNQRPEGGIFFRGGGGGALHSRSELLDFAVGVGRATSMRLTGAFGFAGTGACGVTADDDAGTSGSRIGDGGVTLAIDV